jgi:phosphatidylglycerophosphatase C
VDHAHHPLHSGIDLQKNEDVMKKRIAFFDFDGTITTEDSLLSFIFFRYGKLRTVLGLLTVSPFYAAYLMKLIPAQKAKEKVLSRFLRNESVEKFDIACNQFAKNFLPTIERQKALKEIKTLQEMGTEVVIISASPDNWLMPWCKQIGVSLICTKLETKNGKLTGRIEGKNCRGKEKVRRILASYNLQEYDEVYAYGDTKGDKPMLGLATFAFYQPFR